MQTRLLLVTAAITLVAFGQEAAPRPPANAPAGRRSRGDTRDFLGLGRAPDAAAAARGEKLYTPNCAFCHGARANGAEAPDLVRSTVVLHDDKGEMVGPVVHQGRPERGMPAFPAFTEAQLSDIAEFLHMRVEQSANRGLYQIKDVLTGNAKAGEAYFNGAGKCAGCHSVTGDLAHIGSKLQPADLQQTFLYPGARFDSASNRVPHVTVTLPSGQTLAGNLKRLDDFSVSFYDASGEYHSMEITHGTKVEVEDKLAAHRRLLDQYSDADMHNLTAYLSTLK